MHKQILLLLLSKIKTTWLREEEITKTLKGIADIAEEELTTQLETAKKFETIFLYHKYQKYYEEFINTPLSQYYNQYCSKAIDATQSKGHDTKEVNVSQSADTFQIYVVSMTLQNKENKIAAFDWLTLIHEILFDCKKNKREYEFVRFDAVWKCWKIKKKKI